MLEEPFSEETFPNIKFKPPWCKLTQFPLVLSLAAWEEEAGHGDVQPPSPLVLPRTSQFQLLVEPHHHCSGYKDAFSAGHPRAPFLHPVSLESKPNNRG